MRRPLPNSRPLAQTSCDPADPDCVGTPTPTPGQGGSGGGTPTATPGPGFTFDEDRGIGDGPTSIEDPLPGAVFQWNPGPWTGSGSCGTQAVYTRSIGCRAVTVESGGGGLGPQVSREADARIQLASYLREERPSLSNAVYDPSTGLRTLKVQFGGGGGGSVTVQDVDVGYCTAQAGQIPANTYSGVDGECGSHYEQTGFAEWQIDPFSSGSATCSSQAYRLPTFTCVGPDGGPGDPELCLENVRSGGSRNDGVGTPQYGNYSGCRTGWVGIAEDGRCNDASDADTDHRAFYRYGCTRSDGTVVKDADCTASGPKPVDGDKVLGTCAKVWLSFTQGRSCFSGDSRENVLAAVEVSERTTNSSTAASDLCTSVGASCCEYRKVDNSNYALPLGTWQIIATSTPPFGSGGWHFDENNYRARPQSVEEGPYFLDKTGSAQFYEQEGAENDDPDGILTGGGGGLGPIN